MAQSNLPGEETRFGRIVEVAPGQFAFSTQLGVYAPTAGGGFQGFVQNPQGQWTPVTPTPAAPAAPADGGGGGGTEPVKCDPPYVYDQETNSCMLPADIQRRAEQRAADERRARENEMRQKELERLQGEAKQEIVRQNKESAWGTLQALLSQFGLGSLSQSVRSWIEDGIVNTDELVNRIRSTPEYKLRFPAMERRLKAGYNAISEGTYIALEREYRQTMRTAGLPADFYNDANDFANLIAGDVSGAELSSRIKEGYQAVAQASPTVVNEMRRLYGVDEGGLAAYFLDPEKATPILLRQAQAAQIGAQAQEQAGMAITAGQAEQLAVAGVGAEQARQGFQTINQAEQLFVSLPGTTEQAITQEEQIAGVFGTQAAAQQRVRQRARERAATFQAGGRFAGQGTTVTGLQ